MRRWVVLLVSFLASLGPGIARGQGFPVTAGEHDGFTRLVIHAPPGVSWSMDPDGRQRQLTVTPARAGLDLSRLFDRIARTRLTEAQTDGGTLLLSLGCDCPVTAWEERPGLIVIDIADADPPPEAPLQGLQSQPLTLSPPATVAARVATSPSPQEPPLSNAELQRIGATLARMHIAADAENAPPEVMPTADREALARSLGLPIAQALSQGLLDPALDQPAGTSMVLASPPSGPSLLPENLRISTALDRPASVANPDDLIATTCAESGAEALDFLMELESFEFNTRYAEVARQLYGEFDQPDPIAHLRLIQLYLAAGFGAEARRLLETGTDPIAGRDLLLGLADILEGRNSNSRMRLAQVHECGGPATVFAALAGPDDAPIDGRDAALTFQQLPAGLQPVIAVALVERLIAAGDPDSARIVAETLRRSAWRDEATLAIIDASLAQARGRDAAAVSRLNQLAPGRMDSRVVQRQLDLALHEDRPPATGLIGSAEAFASAERDAERGPDLMAAVIRLHARNGAVPEGFEALDRLASWLPDTGENQQRIAELTDTLWRALSEHGDDLTLVQMILSREDWQSDALAPPTQSALAARLAALGMVRPVVQLLPEPDNATDAVTRALGALELGDPDAALAILDGYETSDALAARAAAFAMRGANEDAAALYQGLGETVAARRSAIAAGAWQRLREIDGPEPEPVQSELAGLLGEEPGHSVSSGAPLDQVPAPPLSAGGGGSAPSVDPPPNLQEPSDQSLQGVARTDRPDALARAPSATDPQVPEVRNGVSASAPGGGPASDDPLPFDRLGLVSRGSVLLSESASLRSAIAPLLEDPP